MRLCADFHAGLSKEYRIFFLLDNTFVPDLSSTFWGFVDRRQRHGDGKLVLLIVPDFDSITQKRCI